MILVKNARITTGGATCFSVDMYTGPNWMGAALGILRNEAGCYEIYNEGRHLFTLDPGATVRLRPDGRVTVRRWGRLRRRWHRRWGRGHELLVRINYHNVARKAGDSPVCEIHRAPVTLWRAVIARPHSCTAIAGGSAPKGLYP